MCPFHLNKISLPDGRRIGSLDLVPHQALLPYQQKDKIMSHKENRIAVPSMEEMRSEVERLLDRPLTEPEYNFLLPRMEAERGVWLKDQEFGGIKSDAPPGAYNRYIKEITSGEFAQQQIQQRGEERLVRTDERLDRLIDIAQTASDRDFDLATQQLDLGKEEIADLRAWRSEVMNLSRDEAARAAEERDWFRSLQAKDEALAARQQREQRVVQPAQFAAMGYKPTYDETGELIGLEKLSQEELYAGMGPLERSQYDLAMAYTTRQQKALAGELPIDPSLENELTTQKNLLTEQLTRKLGSNFMASTAGQQAMRTFEESSTRIRESARRGTIESGAGLISGGLQNVAGIKAGEAGYAAGTTGILSGTNLQRTALLSQYAPTTQQQNIPGLMGTIQPLVQMPQVGSFGQAIQPQMQAQAQAYPLLQAYGMAQQPYQFNAELANRLALAEMGVEGGGGYGRLVGTVAGGLIGGYATGWSPQGISAGAGAGGDLGEKTGY